MLSVIYNDGIGSPGILTIIIWLALMVVAIVGHWKLFEKADIPGWLSLIPIVNIYCIYKMAWGNGWVFLAFIVPVIGLFLHLLTMYKLAKAFDKDIGFGLGLMFLYPIFLLILAFGSAQYFGPDDRYKGKDEYYISEA